MRFLKNTRMAPKFLYLYIYKKVNINLKKKKGEGILGITVRTVMLNLFDLF